MNNLTPLASAVYSTIRFTTPPSGQIQRTCACGQHTGNGGECEECKRKREGMVQRAAMSNTSVNEVPPIVHEVLRSPGQPLDAATRGFMEPRFGYDFSGVRVHTDAKASESAQSVNALAYTAGHDVVFGVGQYSPQTSAGQRLMAHELTHVIHQGGERVPAQLNLGPKADAYESEADTIAQSIGPGPVERLPSLRATSSILRIQRQTASDEVAELVEGEAVALEGDATEVHDGDSPVNATPDTAEISEGESSFGGMMLGEAGEKGTSEPAIEPGEAVPVQSPGAGSKGNPKSPPTQKTPPRKITKIDVDQAAQTITLIWSDGTTEGPRPVSTGRGLPNTKDDPCETQQEKNCTPNGDFKVGSLGNADTKNSHGDRMSWYAGFVDDRGIGIHDSQPVPGTPASHGCVRVGNSPADDAFAKKINKNVVPHSTVVHVFGKAATKPWKKAVPAPKPKKK